MSATQPCHFTSNQKRYPKTNVHGCYYARLLVKSSGQPAALPHAGPAPRTCSKHPLPAAASGRWIIAAQMPARVKHNRPPLEALVVDTMNLPRPHSTSEGSSGRHPYARGQRPTGRQLLLVATGGQKSKKRSTTSFRLCAHSHGCGSAWCIPQCAMLSVSAENQMQSAVSTMYLSPPAAGNGA